MNETASLAAPTDAVLERLADKHVPVLTLLALCRTPQYRDVWPQGPELPRRFARLLLKQGHPASPSSRRPRAGRAATPTTPTCSTAALSPWPAAATPLAPRCSCRRCPRPSRPIAAHRSDALSLAGRTRKDVAARPPTRASVSPGCAKPFDFYRQAYDLAATFLPRRQRRHACPAGPAKRRDRSTLAAGVRDAVLAGLDPPGAADADYWLPTLGEAYLLLGDADGRPGTLRPSRPPAATAHDDGDIASMRRQLRLLLREPAAPRRRPAGPVPPRPGGRLRRPRVSTGPATVRFPADPTLEAAVRRAIHASWTPWKPPSAIAVPACGSDLRCSPS